MYNNVYQYKSSKLEIVPPILAARGTVGLTKSYLIPPTLITTGLSTGFVLVTAYGAGAAGLVGQEEGREF